MVPKKFLIRSILNFHRKERTAFILHADATIYKRQVILMLLLYAVNPTILTYILRISDCSKTPCKNIFYTKSLRWFKIETKFLFLFPEDFQNISAFRQRPSKFFKIFSKSGKNKRVF